MVIKVCTSNTGNEYVEMQRPKRSTTGLEQDRLASSCYMLPALRSQRPLWDNNVSPFHTIQYYNLNLYCTLYLQPFTGSVRRLWSALLTVTLSAMAYIGSAEDSRRIRKQQEQREKEKKEFEEKKKQAGAGAGLRQFGAGTTEVPSLSRHRPADSCYTVSVPTLRFTLLNMIRYYIYINNIDWILSCRCLKLTSRRRRLV